MALSDIALDPGTATCGLYNSILAPDGVPVAQRTGGRPYLRYCCGGKGLYADPGVPGDETDAHLARAAPREVSAEFQRRRAGHLGKRGRPALGVAGLMFLGQFIASTALLLLAGTLGLLATAARCVSFSGRGPWVSDGRVHCGAGIRHRCEPGKDENSPENAELNYDFRER